MMHASGEFRWFRQVHSENQSPHFVPHFLSLESTTGMNFTTLVFILLDILPSGDSLYLCRQINLFLNKILNVLGLWDSFGSCE